MDYKEKYEQGLECLEEILNSGQEKIKMTLLKERLLPFFPELEREDEKMRKKCINFLNLHKRFHAFSAEIDECITWLENQKATDKEIIFRALPGTDIIVAAKQALEKIEIGKEVVLAFNGAYIPVNGKTVAEICNEYFAWTEKQGESIDVDSILNKVGVKCAYKDGNAWCILYGDNIQDGVCGFGYTKEEALIEFLKELLEKQGNEPKVSYTTIVETGDGGINALVTRELPTDGCDDEQKPTDKVKPKFKIGEWITNGDYTWKIVEVKPLDYIIQSQNGNIVDDTISHVDKQFHSFTIEDAKDGDVLYSLDSKQPFIFKHRKPNEQAEAYCGLNIYGKFFVWGTKDCVITLSNYIPATKEQRDTLFKKMKEAGYQWDAEKKELKKIEDEIEIPFGAKDSELQEVTYYIPKGFHAEIDDDKVVIKKGDKPTWSEEDDAYKLFAISAVEDYYDVKNPLQKAIVEWLKSLKDRVQPKPKTWSEDDEEFYNDIIKYFSDLDYSLSNDEDDVINWLKSLKERLS